MTVPHADAAPISRTAAWVAAFRAAESARHDRLFNDPYAARFALDPGVSRVRGGNLAAAVVTARTVTFDALILRTIAHEHIDAVLSLACGYDTRPYRLPIPPSVTWIECDLPYVLRHKAAQLEDAKACCRIEHVAGDLRLPEVRARLLADVAARFKRVLVITEGLLLYLTPDEAHGLAAAFHGCPPVCYWLTDLMSPAARNRMNRMAHRELNNADTRLNFAPAAGARAFVHQGWDPVDARGTFAEMRRIGRMPGLIMGTVLHIAAALAPHGFNGTVLLRARKDMSTTT
ncbi:MAG: class I SAM-dependent methyltransferase [Rhodospirillaceae bacterium]|nr:class I SAM-dependent methyltransferase [Rhodospirillaceae bacterium]